MNSVIGIFVQQTVKRSVSNPLKSLFKGAPRANYSTMFKFHDMDFVIKESSLGATSLLHSQYSHSLSTNNMSFNLTIIANTKTVKAQSHSPADHAY
jgi:hypothetical protein